MPVQELLDSPETKLLAKTLRTIDLLEMNGPLLRELIQCYCDNNYENANEGTLLFHILLLNFYDHLYVRQQEPAAISYRQYHITIFAPCIMIL